MSIINRMYRSMKVDGEQLKKNPNRVAGGIRGAGSNTLTVVDESGVERTVPTSDYIRALEAQIRTQNQVLTMLEKRISKLSKD
jgi:hypothetical protein